jgi:hypothetical protein
VLAPPRADSNRRLDLLLFSSKKKKKREKLQGRLSLIFIFFVFLNFFVGFVAQQRTVTRRKKKINLQKNLSFHHHRAWDRAKKTCEATTKTFSGCLPQLLLIKLDEL